MLVASGMNVSNTASMPMLDATNCLRDMGYYSLNLTLSLVFDFS